MDRKIMDLWKSILLTTFGKKAKRKWMSAAFDFELVDQGIKPVCLFDHWSVTPQEMQDLTLGLYKQGLTRGNINVIGIGQDVAIYSLSHGKRLLADSLDCKHFVDVTSSLSNPALANNELLSETTVVFSNLCKIIHDVCDSQDSSFVYNVPITDRLNGPCLFGLLLGYPCVYWFDPSMGDNHCLSGQSLRLFQVRGQKKAQTAYGNPCTSEKYKPVKSDKTMKKCDILDKIHVIFSFTVPEKIVLTLESHVHSWFVKWRDSAPWNCMFDRVWLDEESVTPQSVCL